MTASHRLLPPRLVLLLAAVMTVLHVTAPVATIVPWPWNLLGGVVLVGGMSLTVASARRFARVETNIVTFDEPTKLVSDGWFRRTRNPMYVGFAAMLVGGAVLSGTLSAWIGPAVFIIVANWWYIPFEERAMREAFGDDYDSYRQRVRRWI